MNTMSPVKKSVITAACIALCAVLPQAFHAFPAAGAVYSPLHIPVLLCALVCSWQYGLLCALVGPLLCFISTGLPPAAVLPPVLAECAVLGVVAGLMLAAMHTKKTYVDLYISLITAMAVGRVAGGVVSALLYTSGSYSLTVWGVGYFLTGLAGIAVQLALIPAAVLALMKAGLIPPRYSDAE